MIVMIVIALILLINCDDYHIMIIMSVSVRIIDIVICSCSR
jgi:hypothetical protein